MNFGFNSNVRVQAAVYHVQTEDRGPAHPYLDTVVYENGRVVHKRSTSYEAFAATTSRKSDFAEQLHELLSQQHREVIEQLEAGTLSLLASPRTHVAPAVFTDFPTATQNTGLDVRLKNPKTWLSTGSTTPEVTLEIELRKADSQLPVNDAEVEALFEYEKSRVHCLIARTDVQGNAILKFPMPATASDGSSLVIRATDGSVYGELRFLLKARQRSARAPSAPTVKPVSISK